MLGVEDTEMPKADMASTLLELVFCLYSRSNLRLGVGVQKDGGVGQLGWQEWNKKVENSSRTKTA
jgi:hypothetical protein